MLGLFVASTKSALKTGGGGGGRGVVVSYWEIHAPFRGLFILGQ